MDEFDVVTAAPIKTSVWAKIAAVSTKVKIIVAASVATALGAGGAFAFSAYQSPETVVGMAIGSLFSESNPGIEVDMDINSVQASGTGALTIYTSDLGTSMSMKVNATVNEAQVGATLNAVAAKAGDIYLNLSDFDSLGYYLVSSGLMPESTITAARTALTDKWVKVSKEELGTYTGQSDCISNKLDNTEYMKQAGKQMGEALRNNYFMTIAKELPQVDGDRVFELGVSAEKLRAFLTAAKATNYYSDIISCTGTEAITASQIESINQADIDKAIGQTGVKVTVYANAFSHKLSKMTFGYTDPNTNQSVKLSLKALGSHPEKVFIPAESVSLQEMLLSLSAGAQLDY